VYDEAIDPDEIRLQGAAAGAGDPVLSESDTTLTISPATSWADSDGAAAQFQVGVQDLEGNGADETDIFSFIVDGTGPIAVEINPPRDAVLGRHTVVNLTFDEPVNEETLAVSGTLSGDTNTEWAGTEDRPVLRIEPSSSWVGTNGTLVITVADRLGNVGDENLNYHVDTVGPRIIDHTPSATRILPNQEIVIEFSKQVRPGSVSISGTMVAAAPFQSWTSRDGGTTPESRLTLNPNSDWVTGTSATLEIRGADYVGNPMEGDVQTLTFHVDGSGPVLEQADPVDESLLNANSTIVLTFDESINTAAFESADSGIAAEADYSWSVDDTVLTIDPESAWSDGDGQSLVLDVADTLGNTSHHELTFDIDAISPSIAGSVPEDDGTLGVFSEIVIDYSEEMDTESIEFGGSIVSTSLVAVFSSADGGTTPNSRQTLSPEGSWSAGEDRELHISGTDVAGNPISTSTFALTFDVDENRPQITGADPVDLATIRADADIEVTFGEEIDHNLENIALSGTLGEAAGDPVEVSSDKLVLTIRAPEDGWADSDGAVAQLGIDTRDQFGNGAGTVDTLSYVVDGTAPEVSDVAPGNNSLLGATTKIVVTFSEEVDQDSVVLSGTLGDASTRFWTTDEPPKLELTPDVAWPGAGGSLNLVFDDLRSYEGTHPLTFTVDATAPEFAASDPESGATVNGSHPIVVDFDSVMDPDSLSVTGSMVGDFDVAWSSADEGTTANSRVTVTPDGVWNEGESLQMTVSASDLAGNGLDEGPKTLTYAVDRTGPVLQDVQPASGSRIGGEQSIVLTFDEELMEDSHNLTGGLSSHVAFQFYDGATVTLQPNVTLDWPEGNDQTLNVEVADLLSNLSDGTELIYSVDLTPPQREATPESGSQLHRTSEIQIEYDEPMYTGSDAVTLGGTMGSQAQSSWSEGDTILTIVPSSGAWEDNETATLTVAATDLAGLGSPLNLNYDVDGVVPELTPTPASGGTLLPGATLVLLFDETMDTEALEFSGDATTGAGTVTVEWSDGDTRARLTPESTWNFGDSRELDVSFADLAGNADDSTLSYAVHFAATVDDADGYDTYESRVALVDDGETVMLAYRREFPDNTADDELRFATSLDGGATWSGATLDLAPSLTDLTMAVDGLRPTVGYFAGPGGGNPSNVAVQRGANRGSSWDPVTAYVPDGTFPEAELHIALRGPNIYLAFQERTPGPETLYETVLARSFNAGETWNQEDFGHASPCLDHPGGLTFADNGIEEPTIYISGRVRGERGIHLAASFDGGATFGGIAPNCNDVNTSGPPFYRPAIAAVGSIAPHSVYVAYMRDAWDGDDEAMMFSRSDDNGFSWSGEDGVTTVVEENGNRLGLLPSMAVSFLGDRVYLAYLDSDDDTVRFARSDDEGDTWNTPVSVADTGSSTATGSHTAIAIFETEVTDETVVVITYHNADDDSLRFIRSDDNGDTW